MSGLPCLAYSFWRFFIYLPRHPPGSVSLSLSPSDHLYHFLLYKALLRKTEFFLNQQLCFVGFFFFFNTKTCSTVKEPLASHCWAFDNSSGPKHNTKTHAWFATGVLTSNLSGGCHRGGCDSLKEVNSPFCDNHGSF
uniref:Uncharacterized protein n=1 Tax=Sphaerodactylus townsendi TaxID=933632 RepID=A0ACB8FZB6_9SAUR